MSDDTPPSLLTSLTNAEFLASTIPALVAALYVTAEDFSGEAKLSLYIVIAVFYVVYKFWSSKKKRANAEALEQEKRANAEALEQEYRSARNAIAQIWARGHFEDIELEKKRQNDVYSKLPEPYVSRLEKNINYLAGIAKKKAEKEAEAAATKASQIAVSEAEALSTARLNQAVANLTGPIPIPDDAFDNSIHFGKVLNRLLYDDLDNQVLRDLDLLEEGGVPMTQSLEDRLMEDDIQMFSWAVESFLLEDAWEVEVGKKHGFEALWYIMENPERFDDSIWSPEVLTESFAEAADLGWGEEYNGFRIIMEMILERRKNY